jgi:alanine racemase
MSAVRHNVGVVRAAVGESVRICAILKADAYGHGAATIARELAGSGARRQPLVDAVAVATFEEAESLGRMAVPVYVLRPVESLTIGAERARLEEAIRLGWVMSVNSVAAARDLARVAQTMRGVPALVQVAVDTGMARAGVSVEEFDEVAAAVTRQASLRLVSVCTHFVASEDVAGPATREQFDLFRRVTDGYAAAHPGLVRHVANSGGIFLHPGTHLEMVRPGKAIYGIDPSGAPADGRDLRPILRWVAPLLMVRDLKKGQTVGYGATYVAERDMRLGLIAVGFADGYMRCLSGRGTMLVGGREAPVVGRVSMDYTTIDLSGVPDAAAGDTVTIIDDNAASPASIYNIARLAGTIPSEILCGIGARVPRIATGQQVASLPGTGERAARERGRWVRAAG